MSSRHATSIGVFEISAIPAQPQIAHCHGFFVPVAIRGRGMAHELKQIQLNTLAEQCFDYATATVDSANFAQKKVLDKAGFNLLDSFDNQKTGGVTELWGRPIKGSKGCDTRHT